MLIPVLRLLNVVKTSLSLPLSLVFHLILHRQIYLINQRERKRQMFFWVCVKVRRIVCNVLAKLFFLELPDVQLLVTIRIYFYTIWHINPLLKGSSSIHVMHFLLVWVHKASWTLLLSCFQWLVELNVFAVSVGFSFLDFLSFFFGFIIIVLVDGCNCRMWWFLWEDCLSIRHGIRYIICLCICFGAWLRLTLKIWAWKLALASSWLISPLAFLLEAIQIFKVKWITIFTFKCEQVLSNREQVEILDQRCSVKFSKLSKFL